MKNFLLVLLVLLFSITSYGNTQKQKKINQQHEQNKSLEVVAIKNKDFYIQSFLIENFFRKIKILKSNKIKTSQKYKIFTERIRNKSPADLYSKEKL